MKTITYSQYMQLIGLAIAAERQHKILESMVEAAREITGEEDDTGHTMDIMWGSRELDDGLRIMKIKVAPRPKKKAKARS